jgi:hypothetical protein
MFPASGGARAPAHLLERGHVLVMSGWDAELLPDSTRLRLHAPIASFGGRPITGLVRVELSTINPDTARFPFASGGPVCSELGASCRLFMISVFQLLWTSCCAGSYIIREWIDEGADPVGVQSRL